ncbi:alpha/beta hydrolase family protein [Streptomyces sp. NPDC090054]|uniref:alpha/beta hydrolase family protein n=1 Tax=Streptomyces sp. NPDC090054 TaxID=3365933 RepID=UPI003815D00F
MRWLVRPLREAGFRVAALDHHGNNFVDGYEPEGFLHVWDRPRDVSFALDALDREQPLGPVGAAGFSLGGYTAAALAGARVDPGVLWAVLTGEVPFPEIPEFPGVLEELRKTFPPIEESRRALEAAAADLSDSRVRAVFQVAPGVGTGRPAGPPTGRRGGGRLLPGTPGRTLAGSRGRCVRAGGAASRAVDETLAAGRVRVHRPLGSRAGARAVRPVSGWTADKLRHSPVACVLVHAAPRSQGPVLEARRTDVIESGWWRR